jgi:hypothetical protein
MMLSQVPTRGGNAPLGQHPMEPLSNRLDGFDETVHGSRKLNRPWQRESCRSFRL